MKPLKVYLSPTAKRQYLKIIEYLDGNWPYKVKVSFQEKFDEKINQISKNPRSCPESIEAKGIFKAVVEKHNSFYYRIRQDEIEVLIIVDNRQDPDHTKEKIKHSG